MSAVMQTLVCQGEDKTEPKGKALCLQVSLRYVTILIVIRQVSFIRWLDIQEEFGVKFPLLQTEGVQVVQASG